jgi:hypothetical protein
MMVSPSSLEADPAEGRVHAPRQQGSKSSVRSKKKARKGHAARKLKRAFNSKTLGGDVALEAKPLRGAEVEFTAALIPGLMVMTTILQKLVKHSKVVMTAIEHSIRQLKRTAQLLSFWVASAARLTIVGKYRDQNLRRVRGTRLADFCDLAYAKPLPS